MSQNRIETLRLHRSFERLHRFLAEARRVSLNAQVAAAHAGASAAPFAAAVRELGPMTERLDYEIAAVGRRFERVARAVAHALRDEKLQSLYTRAAERAAPRGRAAFARDAEKSGAAIARVDVELRDELQSLLAELVDVRKVAISHSRFIAMVAVVESLREEEQRDRLLVAAQEIRSLAEELAEAASTATAEVRAVAAASLATV